MDRRTFLKFASATPLAASAAPRELAIAPAGNRKLFVLVELKGGNDGLNTVIPFADPQYARLRPRLAIARAQVIQLGERTGLHPALRALHAAWAANDLAIVQGVGYAEPVFSHFRASEIWTTASGSGEFPERSWTSRLGPDVEVRRISMDGFDTHEDQRERHARLLGDLATRLSGLRAELIAAGRWESSLVATVSEFGRGARENATGGTDHGTCAAHFVMGGRVKGGLYGAPPALGRLDGQGQLAHAVELGRYAQSFISHFKFGYYPVETLT
jgi:uncharacterized protein (DUF1501 family)